MTAHANISYACVVDETYFDQYKAILSKFNKDFDVIKDNLGEKRNILSLIYLIKRYFFTFQASYSTITT